MNLDIQEVVAEAHERCHHDPQMITGYQLETTIRSLNLMFVEWSVRGINYWKVDEQFIQLAQGANEYQLPEDTIDILRMVIRRSNVDTTMARISLTEFQELPNKPDQGKPQQFFLDRRIQPKIFIFQSAENSTDTLVYRRVAQIDAAVDSELTADADVTQRWYEAMCGGLAAKLAWKLPKVDKELRDDLIVAAEVSFGFASGDERERATLRITPVTALA